MSRVLLRSGFGAVLGLGVLAATAAPADPPASTSKGSVPLADSKAPDFSGYTFVGDVVGEVIKASDSALTIRVTWYVPQGGNTGRPRLSSNSRNFRNPFMMNRGGNRGRVKEQHHDYVLEYVPESLVRYKHTPPKTDEKGKKVSHTEKEIEELKKPLGVPGYAAEKGDVTPGTYVEVYLIRDRSVPAAKQTEDDLRLKYVFILGHDPNPPKDATTTPPKKKN